MPLTGSNTRRRKAEKMRKERGKAGVRSLEDLLHMRLEDLLPLASVLTIQ